MPGISTLFVSDCREELEFRRKEKDQLLEQLALYDVRIDRYDAIIENMDRSLLPLINEINVAIATVKAAYDARITAGCKSNLVWQQTAQITKRFSARSGYGTSSITTTTFTVVKNPAVNQVYNNYGLKYYRRPKNQDYGSNIIAEFFGTIGAGSTRLAIRQVGLAGTAGILNGDIITDDLENPVTFAIDDLPQIVGFGISTIVIDNVGFGGTIAIGGTVIAQTGIGTTGSISIGNRIESPSVLIPFTTVVGIGTTLSNEVVWDFEVGQFITTAVTVPSVVISQAAVASASTVFTIGITSDFPAYFLSTTADVAANEITNFTVIRQTQSVLDEFDATNNPIDPVTVAIMNNGSVGYGHTTVLVNNGSPVGPFQWREVLGEFDPEPACGNSSVNWYFGNLQYPIKIINQHNNVSPWGLTTVTNVPASEGTTVTIVTGAGVTTPQPGFGYSSSGPINPTFAGCAALDAAIASAEANRDALIARHVPVINATIAAASGLRILRDKLEGQAFTFLQGRAAADAEIVRLTNAVNNLELLDLSRFEPTNFRDANRFSSSTVGIATT